MGVDICLTVLLPILMAEILTGQEFHEWAGTVMAALFIIHHVLNWRWWKNIWKGGYKPVRFVSVMLNLLMLADISALVVSGIMMSGFVFDWLPVSGGMILSRRLHLFASYWGLVLMSLHLGLHWSMAVKLGKRLRKGEDPDRLAVWLARGLAAAVALFGIFALARQNIADYLFLRTAFVFWDETKTAFLYFAEVIAMMGLFIAIGYYGSKLLTGGKCGQMKQKVLKCLAFLVPVLLCAVVILWIGFGNRNNPSDSWSVTAEDSSNTEENGPVEGQIPDSAPAEADDGFVLVPSGTFVMGSPENEAWRGGDERQHTVTVSDFYISPYEVTQAEYEARFGQSLTAIAKLVPDADIGEGLAVNYSGVHPCLRMSAHGWKQIMWIKNNRRIQL